MLVDPASQIAYPEHGPNMMWNLKYSGLNHQSVKGNSSGMMNGYGNSMSSWNNTTPADVSAEMIVAPEQAIKLKRRRENRAASLKGCTHWLGAYDSLSIATIKDNRRNASFQKYSFH